MKPHVMIKNLLSILFSFFLLSCFAQETIVTGDGQTISAYIVKEKAGFILLADSPGDDIPNLKLSKKDIEYIQYRNGYRRTFDESSDLRILKPASISVGLSVAPDNEYGNLFGKADYFITPQFNFEFSAGVSWAVTGVNYYFYKPSKSRTYFPYAGLLGGYDYSNYESAVMLVPAGVSKIFPWGLNIRVGVAGMVALENSEANIYGDVAVGYRFK